MRKITLFLSMLIAMTMTVVAQSAVNLTFTRADQSIAVAITDENGATIEGATATVALSGSTSTWKSNGELATLTNVICPDVNANTNPTIEMTVTINGLGSKKLTSLGLDIHALNSGGNHQLNKSDEPDRHWNVDVKASDASFASYTDLEIARGCVTDGVTHKMHNAANVTATEVTDPATLKLTISKGTNNGGCFFGLEKVVLGVEDIQVTPEAPVYTASVTMNPATLPMTDVAAWSTVENNVATFTAEVYNDKYEFVGWTSGTETVSTDLVYTVTLTENLNLVANFQEKATTPSEPAYDWAGEYTVNATITPSVDLPATMTIVYSETEARTYVESIFGYSLRVDMGYNIQSYPTLSIADDGKSATVDMQTTGLYIAFELLDNGDMKWSLLKAKDGSSTITLTVDANGVVSIPDLQVDNVEYLATGMTTTSFDITGVTASKGGAVEPKPEVPAVKWYRIKETSTGEYMNVYSYDPATEQSAYGLVNVAAYNEEGADQIFTLEAAETEGQYYLRTQNDYYVTTAAWNVNVSNSGKSAIIFEETTVDDLTTYVLRDPSKNASKNYFKIGAVDGGGVSGNFVYCDADAGIKATWVLEEVVAEEPEKPAGIDFDKTYKVKFDAERLSIKDEAYSSYLPTEWDITFQYSSNADKYLIKDFLGANLIDMNYGYTTYTVSDDNPYQFDINIEEGYNTLCMLDDTYENYLIFCNKDGEQSGSITVTVDDEGNATVGDFSVYYLKANIDNGATEELKLVAVYGEDEVVEPAGPEVVFEMTAGQIGTVPQKLSDEDAAKIFDLSTLTIAVKVTTPASMSGRQALLCTSDPTANANTDAMPTGSAYVGYGFNNADFGYLASCIEGDRYTASSGITGGTDNVLVYVLNPAGNNYKSYVNGTKKVDRNFGSYEIATPKMVKEDHANACIYIGGGVTAEGARETYTGTIKGIKIFNGELTAEEIANIVFPEEPEAASYTVTANVAPVSDWGTVTIEGYEGTEASIEEGTEVTLTATPAEGYEFDSWTDIAGNELSKEASYKFTVTADVTVIAYFAEKAVGAEYFSIEKVSPDEGVVTELSQIHLIPTVSSLYDLPTGWTITDANNNSYEVSIEWGMSQWYDILVILKEPITAPGTYTLTIPEGSAQDDLGKIISAATYSWTIKETATGINGIDAENGETVIFDITGRKIETITAPGIYIVNGKKVLVK